MGIDSFYSNLRSILPKAKYTQPSSNSLLSQLPTTDITGTKPLHFDNIYFDVNNLLFSFSSSPSCTTTARLLSRLNFTLNRSIANCSRINKMNISENYSSSSSGSSSIKNGVTINHNLSHRSSDYSPPSSIFIALDGPASRAKLQLQRRRREMEDNLYDGHMISSGSHNTASQIEMIKHCIKLQRQTSRAEKFVIHPVNFTSGTQFMNDLSNHMASNCLDVLQNQRSNSSVMFCSGSNRPGEAEQKIFEFIRFWGKRDETHIIVGDDSDLILFGLQQKDKQIYVNRSSQSLLYDIQALRNTIAEQFKGLLMKDKDVENRLYVDRLIDDFCFLFLLSGNDYMPKLGDYSITKSWGGYMEYKHRHRDEFLINFPSTSHIHVTGDLKQHDKYEINLKFLKYIIPKTRSSRGFSANNDNNDDNDDQPEDNDIRNEKIMISTDNLPKKFALVTEFFCGYLSVQPQFVVTPKSENIFTCQLTFPHKTQQTTEKFQEVAAMRGYGSDSNKAKIDLATKILNSDVLFTYLKQRFPFLAKETYEQILIDIASPQPKSKKTKKHLDKGLEPYFSGIGYCIEVLRGVCPDKTYQYKHAALNCDDILKSELEVLSVPIPQSSAPYLYPIEFCMSVVPYTLSELIPIKELRALMTAESPIADLYFSSPDELAEKWNSDDAYERLRSEILRVIAKHPTYGQLPGMQFETNLRFKRGVKHTRPPTVPKMPFCFRYPRFPLELNTEKAPMPGSPYNVPNPFGLRD